MYAFILFVTMCVSAWMVAHSFVDPVTNTISLIILNLSLFFFVVEMVRTK